jgi:D-alanyl-D-alanine carboxypeptidase (penicillin-binding protein 5/6)
MIARLALAGAFLGLALSAAAPASAQDSSAALLATPAQHVTIFDHATGRVLYCKDCEAPMPPASMSKLMTMLVVAEQLKAGKITPATKFKVSEKAWRQGAQSDGSHMFLPINGEVAVQDLMRGVIVVSANDASIVLAEGVAGSEAGFVDMMNQRATALGLATARFRNVTGLPDPDHVISSADLAQLTSVIIRDHPDLYAMYGEPGPMQLSDPALTEANRKQLNRNPLLGRFKGADGVKTGHTSQSGYGMVGSAVLNDQRRIIVFNGLPSMAARASEAERLISAAFYDFSVTRVAEQGAKVGEADVWMGSKKTVDLVAAQPALAVAHRSVKAGLKAAIVYQAPLPAPIKKGDVVAKLVIEGPGYPRQEIDLQAGADVGRANWFARAGHGLSTLLGGGR